MIDRSIYSPLGYIYKGSEKNFMIYIGSNQTITEKRVEIRISDKYITFDY